MCLTAQNEDFDEINIAGVIFLARIFCTVRESNSMFFQRADVSAVPSFTNPLVGYKKSRSRHIEFSLINEPVNLQRFYMHQLPYIWYHHPLITGILTCNSKILTFLHSKFSQTNFRYPPS